jgi:beta-phosphoglucomutase-like phosphatase (HAD superfamily)
MINAVMFDLDGTLVQSEKLKAMSYAIATQRLRGGLPGRGFLPHHGPP